MSKIKLLYDVIMTMKDKESCSGNLKVVCSKDQVKIFGLDREFEKNMADGKTKAKINLEVDCEGKKVKHESSTEFDGCCSPGSGHHGLMRHMIAHFHGRHSDQGGLEAWGDTKTCCGFKGKLSKLACMLSVLNSLYLLFKMADIKGIVLFIAALLIVREVMQVLFLLRLQKRVFKPIEDLKNGVEEIARGNYDVRVECNMRNEIGLLVASFNEMARKLGESERTSLNTRRTERRWSSTYLMT